MKHKIIYTDGSANAKNLNFGGWAFCEIENDSINVEIGTEVGADSNTMELLAVIKALENNNNKKKLKIISDSQYVIHGVESRLLKKSSSPKNLKDIQLWSRLRNLLKDRHVIWEWVRAHQKDEVNNYVDELARSSYASPEKIKEIEQKLLDAIRKKEEKIQLGDLIWTKSKSQKYVVLVGNIIVNNKLGFLVKLLANRYGREYLFLEKNEKINVVKEKSNKEIELIEEIIKSFKN